MDGDITVESAEGKGTVFTVTAKLGFDRRKKARKERTENISFEGKRILLVEDHPLNVIVAKGLLEKNSGKWQESGGTCDRCPGILF